MNRDLFLAILSMDSYNRGYGFGVNLAGRGDGIGDASLIDVPLPSGSEAADFYAIAYNWRGETVIAYRGSDYFDTNSNINLWSRDIWRGWSNGAGFPFSNAANDNACLAQEQAA